MRLAKLKRNFLFLFRQQCVTYPGYVTDSKMMRVFMKWQIFKLKVNWVRSWALRVVRNQIFEIAFPKVNKKWNFCFYWLSDWTTFRIFFLCLVFHAFYSILIIQLQSHTLINGFSNYDEQIGLFQWNIFEPIQDIQHGKWRIQGFAKMCHEVNFIRHPWLIRSREIASFVRESRGGGFIGSIAVQIWR